MNNVKSTYKVIFSGSTLDGVSKKLVAQRFIRVFNLKHQKDLEKLFCGKLITLKRGLNYTAASRYHSILTSLGADCCLEHESNPLAAESEPDQDYIRKKRRRLAQYSHSDFDKVGLAPK